MHAAEIGQRGAVDDAAFGCAKAVFDNLGRIGAGDGVHRVKADAEAAFDHRADRVKVEQSFQQGGVVSDGINDRDLHIAQRGGADGVQVNVLRVSDLIRCDFRGPRKDLVRQPFRRRATVGAIELDTKVFILAAGIVAGGHDKAAIGLVQADQVGCGGRGQQRALPHDHMRRAIGCGHTQDHLRRAVVEITTVAADDKGFTRSPANRVKNGLHEVFQIMRLHKDAGLFAQAGCAGLLPFDRLGRDGVHGSSSLRLTARSGGRLGKYANRLRRDLGRGARDALRPVLWRGGVEHKFPQAIRRQVRHFDRHLVPGVEGQEQHIV